MRRRFAIGNLDVAARQSLRLDGAVLHLASALDRALNLAGPRDRRHAVVMVAFSDPADAVAAMDAVRELLERRGVEAAR